MNDDIKDLIAALPPHKQLLFGVCCVKRIEKYSKLLMLWLLIQRGMNRQTCAFCTK